MDLKEHVREVPDFPKPGILFYDITTLLKNTEALKECIDEMYKLVKDKQIEKVAAIESRGYIFAVPLALRLGCGFSMIRKPGKLPFETVSATYEKEYGSDNIEIHTDAISKGEKVLIVDDLLATGGTMKAAINLIEELGGEVAATLVMIELTFLPGRKKLEGYDNLSLLKYDK